MNNLRSIREKKRITQVRLGIELGVTQETISGYELGKAMPGADILCRMADYLGTSTDYLLDRTDIPTPPSSKAFSGEEMELIAQYRQLRPEQRAKVLGFIAGLLAD